MDDIKNKKPINNKKMSNSKKKAYRKRKAKKSRINYKLKMWIISIIIILGILTLGTALLGGMLFKIDFIEVNGQSIYSREEIIESSGIKSGENLFLCNLSLAEKKIDSANPFIDNVKIKRKIPNKIIIQADGAEAGFAFRNQDNNIFIVSKRNKIIEQTEDIPENVLEIRGAELESYNIGDRIVYKNQAIKNIVDEIIEVTMEDNLTIDKIDITDITGISFRYDHRIKVFLGMPDDFDYKIATAKEILENKINEQERGKLDVSSIKNGGKSVFSPDYMID